MKANLSRALALAAPAALALLASCSAPARRARAATDTHADTATGRHAAVGWQDMPITPGDWVWSNSGGQSTATFAEGLLQMRCDRQMGAVVLTRRGSAQGQVPVIIVTSAATRSVLGNGTAASTISVSLPARDPLLDAMAISRGRFVVETSGLQTLYVPSWPEVTRVIEDCR